MIGSIREGTTNVPFVSGCRRWCRRVLPTATCRASFGPLGPEPRSMARSMREGRDLVHDPACRGYVSSVRLWQAVDRLLPVGHRCRCLRPSPIMRHLRLRVARKPREVRPLAAQKPATSSVRSTVVALFPEVMVSSVDSMMASRDSNPLGLEARIWSLRFSSTMVK